MMSFIRTDAHNPNFQLLIKELDKELAIRDGDDHAFYDQFNKVYDIKYVVVGYNNDEVCGCGAIKEYNEQTMEVKRMFVPLAMRQKGIASLLLTQLETWAKELGYKNCILETGVKQPEAIALYQKQNYKITPNYGQYTGVDTSVCFEKVL